MSTLVLPSHVGVKHQDDLDKSQWTPKIVNSHKTEMSAAISSSIFTLLLTRKMENYGHQQVGDQGSPSRQRAPAAAATTSSAIFNCGCLQEACRVMGPVVTSKDSIWKCFTPWLERLIVTLTFQSMILRIGWDGQTNGQTDRPVANGCLWHTKMKNKLPFFCNEWRFH